jgi:SAM-dependent methyltransferase
MGCAPGNRQDAGGERRQQRPLDSKIQVIEAIRKWSVMRFTHLPSGGEKTCRLLQVQGSSGEISLRLPSSLTTFIHHSENAMKLNANLIRRIIPSVAVLARTPVAPVLDIFDWYIRKDHPEWAKLPPASLRMRIGVGNLILRNHQAYLLSQNLLSDELGAKGYLKTGSSVLELGCGCGRYAIGFARFLKGSGSYTGVDVDRSMIAWCRKHLETPGVQFFHADVYSKVYNPRGGPSRGYRFPVEDSSVSLVASNSLFSHLLYPEFEHYMKETGRVLQKGGIVHLTLFIMDYIRERLGERWTFSHKAGDCYVENLRYPEAAVAYDLDVVRRVLAQSGLTLVEVYNGTMHQQSLIARR